MAGSKPNRKLPWEAKVDRKRKSRPMPDEQLEARGKQEKIRVHKKYMANREKTGDAPVDKQASMSANQASSKAKKLAGELAIMRSLEPKTIDGEYSCKFSAWESGIAAGPMGATSGGLRPLGPEQFSKILAKGSDDANTRKMQEKLSAAIGAAKDVKLISPDTKGAAFQRKFGSVQKIEVASVHKIKAEMSQIQKDEKMRLRQELEEQRALARQVNDFVRAQRARNPLKDHRKFEDTLMPTQGPSMGGWGPS